MPNGHGDDYRVDHGDLNDLRDEILTEADVRRIVREEIEKLVNNSSRSAPADRPTQEDDA